MPGLASTGLGADEAALAQRAAAGDGDAFATLYERYESRAFNLCYRILGSRDDAADATQEAFLGVLRRLPKLDAREFAFGSYVFTSARNACYDLIERRRRAEPSDEIPEHATPVGGGVGGGGTGFDPGDPEDDPERNVLLEARTKEIRAANLTLPERQREVLALRELEELSYDEIADIMDMNRNSVAQLISRARLGLRDALRGTALAAHAGSSPDCERALPLIARQQDGQLDEEGADAVWLGDHLIACDSCRLGREAMDEAGLSYRAWVPVGAAPLLFRETMARAAELVGADWSEVMGRREAERADASGDALAHGASGEAPARGVAAGTGGAASGAAGASARAALLRHRGRNLLLVALLGSLLLLVGLVGATSDDEPPPPAEVPVANEEPVAGDEPAPEPKPRKSGKKPKPDTAQPATTPSAPAAGEDPVEPTAAGDSAPAAPVTNERPARPRKRGAIERREAGAEEGELTPGVTPEPPPEQPPPPPPPEEPPPPPPEQPPQTCRDAAGLPIPCGTDPRTPSSCPPSPSCPPRGGRPPRR